MLVVMSHDDRPRILLDCDPGHDDAIAIIVAASCADLAGITTVAGNAPLDRTTYNACVLRDALSLRTTVHSGASRPLLAEPKFAEYVHGESGLDGADLPAPERGPDGIDAVGFIIETCRAEPGLWLVATGPLTNIALALRAAPDLVDTISGVSLMGGGTFGNRTPLAEFNIWADPDAAAIVFSSGADITMAGLDVTHQFVVTPERIEESAALNAPFTDMITDLFRFFAANYISRHDRIRGAALHDPLAVMAVTHRHLFEVVDTLEDVDRHVAIETTGRHTTGATVIDHRTISDRAPANVHVLERVDDTAAWQIVMESLADANEAHRGRSGGSGPTAANR
jgi:inosine-uridine nucleoside N-ribohydrolase